MAQKSFFIYRTPAQKQEELKMKREYREWCAVETIWDLGEKEGLILQFPIIPLRFLGRRGNQAADSRLNYRWGEFLPISQPQTQQEAYECAPYIPLIGRMRALDQLRTMKQKDIHIIGLRWTPVQGNDRRPRLVPLDAVVEGVKIYAYAHQLGTGIQANKKYVEAEVVQREGGQVICKVPSRTQKRQKYAVVLHHVPLLPGKEENAIILSLCSNFEGDEPGRDIFLHDLRYAYGPGRQTSDREVFGPHAVAAYLQTVRTNWRGLDNTVPLRMNPFPLPSKAFFRFAQVIGNQVLIFDPTLSSKDKLRNLHLDERCMLLSRATAVKGPWETVYWDPSRDGPLHDYQVQQI